MDEKTRDLLIEHLAGYVSRSRIERIRQVLSFRTRYVTLVLEDVYKAQNASATLRTCECLGVQDVHVVESVNPFSVDEEVTIGASKWITLHRNRGPESGSTRLCFDSLRQRGYRIVATTLSGDSRPPGEIGLDQKLAFVFGNEESGLSEQALRSADECVKLPMFGFTQSYNITVSVAIVLSGVIGRLHRSEADWRLSESEKKELTLAWYREAVRRSDLIEKRYLGQLQSK